MRTTQSEVEAAMMTTPMEQLKHGQLYRIHARNAGIGVWDSIERGFHIARFKMFPPRYLFLENHYDSDPTYGTAWPLEELPEPVQDTNDARALLRFLEDMIEKYKERT